MLKCDVGGCAIELSGNPGYFEIFQPKVALRRLSPKHLVQAQVQSQLVPDQAIFKNRHQATFFLIMGTPADALPLPIAEDAIQALLRAASLPRATTIVSPKVTAQYHAIYFITLPPSDRSRSSSELVLRVSGHHLPTIKTRNEIGVMTWLAKNTTIPIPEVIAYDASAENPIAHEYTLLTRIRGVPLSDVYESLDDQQTTWILDQLIDFLSQLQAHPWEGIGGLALGADGESAIAQVVDESFWQAPDVEQFWPLGETVATLNIQGPYRTYVDYVSAQVKQYIRLIRIHHNLWFMLDAIPRLEAFIAALPLHSAELNKVPLRLAHKDLHFANIMFDPSSDTITAVLDWEFSGVVPFTKWNPRRSFLWNGRDDERSADEKQRMMRLFSERCTERKKTSLLEEAGFTSPLQESMQEVADFLRAIVEVAPRGQRHDLVQAWKATVLRNMEPFGV